MQAIGVTQEETIEFNIASKKEYIRRKTNIIKITLLPRIHGTFYSI